MSEHTDFTPTQRFASIMNGLMGLWINSVHSLPVSLPLFYVVDLRLRSLLTRFCTLAARIEAGTFRVRPSRPRRARAPDSPPPTKRPLPPGLAAAMALTGAAEVPRLPRAARWLLGLLGRNASATATLAAQLHALLEDPAMQALIAAAPDQMGRILRALARMLGVDSKLIPQRPRRPRARRARPPRAEPIAAKAAPGASSSAEAGVSGARARRDGRYAPGMRFKISREKIRREKAIEAALREEAAEKVTAAAQAPNAIQDPSPKPAARRGWVALPPGLFSR